MGPAVHKPLSAAFVAGSASAVAAALVSLPLRSPHDALLNTASVVWGVLALSVAGGLVWRRLSRGEHAARRFAAAMAAGFLAWVGVAFALETMLERMVSFSVPLAAIGFGGVGLLTPPLSRAPLATRRPVMLAAIAIAVVIGIGLAGSGDQQSGRLELPPRAGAASTPVAWIKETAR